MEVVKNLDNWNFVDNSIVTIGTFDGVHRGHKKLLQKLIEIRNQKGGKSVVFTFEPHPRKVLFPDQTDLQLLANLEEKIALIKAEGIDVVIVYPFTKEFSQIEPEKFIKEILVEKLKVKTETVNLINKVYSIIDKAVKKGVIHKNTAARKKSKIGKMFVKM